jgi:S1-C subfamily serine protease
VSAGVLAGCLAPGANAAVVPVALAEATVHSALASAAAGFVVAAARVVTLAKGASMSLSSATMTVVALTGITLGAACLGTAAVAHDERPVRVGAPAKPDQPKPPADKKEAEPREKPAGFLGVMLKGDEDGGRVIIHEVFADSPAAKAGLKADDVLVSVAKVKVKEPSEAVDALKGLKPGDKVVIHIRRDDRGADITVTLGTRPADLKTGEHAPPAAEKVPGFLGLKLSGEDGTVIVNEVFADSPAAKAGVKADDVLLKINQADAKEPEDVVKQMSGLKAGDKVALRIKRGDKEIDVTVTAAKRPADFGPM